MKLKRVLIENYRNLTSTNIEFDESCNFIVGENNIGKSNILNLFNIIFNRRGFSYEDFADATLPILIHISIKLANEEIGHFEDLFDIEDYSNINIICRQVSPEENLEFFHMETETYISPTLIKCLNFIYYDSLRNPMSEISFDSSKGVGRFLSRMIKDYLSDKDIDINNVMDTRFNSDLLVNINSKLGCIKSFTDYGIQAIIEGDLSLVFPKLISLKDKKGGSLSKCGYGVQFLLLVTLSILEKLQMIYNQRGDSGIFVNDKNGERSISMVLGLDEPEIHLHPYMQRSLIKYLNRIIDNEDSHLRILIKDLFGIDKFNGQIIIATHSPNIILNDFRQIIRVYRNGEETNIISGANLSLGEQLEKHLLLHFPFIKESFFARCAIFVEGDSEFGSFPWFAKKCDIDIDDYGICIIQAGGDSVLQLIELSEKFGIPCVGIKDSDGDNSPTGDRKSVV